jgi:hypothetical protein
MLVGGGPSAATHIAATDVPARTWHAAVRHWVEFLSREHTLVRYDERDRGRGGPVQPCLLIKKTPVTYERRAIHSQCLRFFAASASSD